MHIFLTLLIICLNPQLPLKLSSNFWMKNIDCAVTFFQFCLRLPKRLLKFVFISSNVSSNFFFISSNVSSNFVSFPPTPSFSFSTSVSFPPIPYLLSLAPSSSDLVLFSHYPIFSLYHLFAFSNSQCHHWEFELS